MGITFIFNGRIRSEIIYGKIFSNSHHQIYTYTALDRYPELFAECKKYFIDIKNNSTPKILSFGCSSGEEVFSIGKYMPQATIIGIDINKWCIKQCRKKNMNQNHFFYTRSSKKFNDIKDFDAIFCMAVLQRTENRTSANNSIANVYTFSKFENEIIVLNEKLKVGGLFIIDESDFNFLDSSCSSDYEPLIFKNNQILKKRPLFDKNNMKIAESQFHPRVFVKFK